VKRQVFFSKEDTIRFSTKTTGIFDVIRPEMASEEIFDSAMLESMISSMIQQGKRNVAVDLSPLDYIYSDAMNKLLAVNRQVLDVSGRLVLLAPRPEVRQILERAGIHNFLKIFATEEELARSSEDIIKQTQSISLDAIRALKAAAPKSDFEDFRSEIDRAFEEPAEGATAMPPPSPAPAAFRPPAPPKRPEPVPPAFITQPQRPMQPPLGFPQQAMQPPAAGPAIRPAPAAPSFIPSGPVQQQFAPSTPVNEPVQQFYQPQAPHYAQPQQQMPPVQDFHMPPQQRPPVAPPLKPMYQAPAAVPAEIQKPAGEDYADFSAGGPADQKATSVEKEPSAPPVPARPADDERRSRDAFEDEEIKKKFPVGALLIVVLIIAIGVTGFFLFQKGIISFTKKETQTTPPPAPASIPQLAVEEERKYVTEEEAKLVEEEETKAEEAKPAAGKKRVSQPSEVASVTPKKIRPVPAPDRAPESAMETPKPAAPALPTSASNQLFVTSLPPGATVRIDGENQGTTPYAWPNPSVYGEFTIEVEKPGYQSQKKRAEYTGGILKEHFVLEKEAQAPATSLSVPPPAVEAPRPPEPKPEPVAVEKPAPAPAPPAPSPVAEPPRAAVSAAAAPQGEAGTIFIASIPPVADVYMDGVLIGKTNVDELKVTAGTHTMRFVKGTKELTKVMTFQAGKNASQMVKIP